MISASPTRSMIFSASPIRSIISSASPTKTAAVTFSALSWETHGWATHSVGKPMDRMPTQLGNPWMGYPLSWETHGWATHLDGMPKMGLPMGKSPPRESIKCNEGEAGVERFLIQQQWVYKRDSISNKTTVGRQRGNASNFDLNPIISVPHIFLHYQESGCASKHHPLQFPVPLKKKELLLGSPWLGGDGADINNDKEKVKGIWQQQWLSAKESQEGDGVASGL
ncbi:hypothetical protein FB446DRAFT_703661 [Lentinula raphanica]|nr:hypothetical protein FB446DRAFT_703661 [Lentinula raphanica]